MYYHNLDFLSQSKLFIFALIFGAIVCVFYSVGRGLLLHRPQNSPIQIASDIIFFIIFAFAFLTFDLVFYSGKIRGFEIIGVCAGFILFYITIGKMLKNAVNKVLTALLKPFRKMIALISEVFQKVKVKLSHAGKNLLKITKGLLYNYKKSKFFKFFSDVKKRVVKSVGKFTEKEKEKSKNP